MPIVSRVMSAPSTNVQRSAARVTAGTPLLAEYRGAGGTVVRGPVTGKTYVFAGLGARVTIDARDKDLGRTVRGLKVVVG